MPTERQVQTCVKIQSQTQAQTRIDADLGAGTDTDANRDTDTDKGAKTDTLVERLDCDIRNLCHIGCGYQLDGCTSKQKYDRLDA